MRGSTESDPLGGEPSPAPGRACDPRLARGQAALSCLPAAPTMGTGQGRRGWQVAVEGSQVHMGQGGGRRAKAWCPCGSKQPRAPCWRSGTSEGSTCSAQATNCPSIRKSLVYLEASISEMETHKGKASITETKLMRLNSFLFRFTIKQKA